MISGRPARSQKKREEERDERVARIKGEEGGGPGFFLGLFWTKEGNKRLQSPCTSQGVVRRESPPPKTRDQAGVGMWRGGVRFRISVCGGGKGVF